MRVLLTGGGTGGHIYPALALANHLKNQDPSTEFLYIGTENGLEADIVPKAGYNMSSINVSGFKRKLSLHNFKVLYQFMTACLNTRKIIKQFKPDIAIGTGGYVAGPVIYTAEKMGIPTIIHEQNAVPGLTNKFLARIADTVAVTFPESDKLFNKAKKVVVTGNPRASEVAIADATKGREALKLSNSLPIVLVVGGSRGAKAINDSMEQLLIDNNDLPFQLIFVTGNIHFDRFNNMKRSNNVHIVPFLYNMPDVLACTDLVIGRAGATFLAEITSLGIPAILIPSPYVTNNHQLHNAKALESVRAAVIIEEKNLHTIKLADEIMKLLNNTFAMEEYKASSKKLGLPNSAELLIKEIKLLTKLKQIT
ncbi:undecaprenyldiphospho-muramoylpentapeptide beta-N-acetylglucosaminyltransferase [Desulfuribacillus alkaliarsenatis]|uniref:UDP-N-acetylglucosamine--N-acetylmuramyl-(pentapeptide) pyrophosphoryl-undecaprenol N-acetylglucosamine transferase n=1 Tax=Desulfuribacillus alkaliarsenatis TaxID=766136 RepID=A0A1E5FZZ9_9FIRM|nr:undecaprenyldiphospho-muramoylpentapeptide beta-N-acetylglucosaminyltransferase [Desulfuribacillus alkaliarsenatis]OEF96073.1 undecaprenyldiphospho-muramoylpentapeptide beta-N-acetylglucosaminyltransferase [Desulfuribacillus alkaliarsenatis]